MKQKQAVFSGANIQLQDLEKNSGYIPIVIEWSWIWEWAIYLSKTVCVKQIDKTINILNFK